MKIAAVAGLLAGLAVCGCGTAQVYHARAAILGMNATDLIACAGIPDRVMQTSAAELLLQYDQKPLPNSAWLAVSLPFGIGAKLGAPAECHAHFRVLRDGTVAGVSFSGPSMADNAGSCAGLVSECLEHPDQTALPPGYDAFSVLLPSKGKSP